MPSFDTIYWDTNGSNGGLVGGSGTWSTSVANWNQNSDGSGDNIVWPNGVLKEADFSSGGGTITLGTNITTGQIYTTDTCTFTGSYVLTIGYGLLGSSQYIFKVPVSSSEDTTYGFQAINPSSLTFEKGLECNSFNFGGSVVITQSLNTTSNSITHQISDSLILNCTSSVAGNFTINSGGSLTVTANNTASFNSLFDTYTNDITSNGLLNLNSSVQISGVPTFKGTGTTAIYSDITGDYDLIKAGTGTVFLSGSKNSLNSRDIKINEGIFKIKPDTTFNSSNFICSGTLNLIGNTSIFGNVTFATGTLRLGI